MWRVARRDGGREEGVLVEDKAKNKTTLTLSILDEVDPCVLFG